MKVCVSLLARVVFILALLSPVVVSCAGQVADTGAGGTSGSGMISCGGAGGTSALATWTNVRDVVDNTCHGSDCHTKGERALMLLDTGSTPLSDADLYSTLTTFKTDELCSSRVLVKPCAPQDSAFYLAQAGMCGANLPYMPFGCSPAYDNCTPADKLEGIRQWIANGAPKP